MAAVENGKPLKTKDMCVQFLIDGYLIGTVCRGEFGTLTCPRKARKGKGWHSKYTRAERVRQVRGTS